MKCIAIDPQGKNIQGIMVAFHNGSPVYVGDVVEWADKELPVWLKPEKEAKEELAKTEKQGKSPASYKEFHKAKANITLSSDE